MTLEEYVKNPFKNNAVPAITRDAIKHTYRVKFDNILLREGGKIHYYFYKDTKNNAYYAHIKVPSEVIENFYYDTIFKFFTDASVKENGRNLEKYNVQFFSNDPSFVFTYAHAFIVNGLFITELSPKMSKEAINKEAKEKNPQNLSGYVKSVYFAYIFLKDRGLLNLSHWSDAPELNLKNLLNSIEHADQKIVERQDEERKRNKKKKIKVDNDLAKKINRIGISDESRSRLITTTKKTGSIKKTKAINSTKITKRIKKK